MTEKNIPLGERIEGDLQSALKARDATRTSTLRMVRAALQNETIARRGAALSDGDALSVLQREAKRRRESVEQFRAGGRNDLAEKESVELSILTEYLPTAFTDEELNAVIAEAKRASGATAAADFGKLMGRVMESVHGRADGNRVSAAVKAALS